MVEDNGLMFELDSDLMNSLCGNGYLSDLKNTDAIEAFKKNYIGKYKDAKDYASYYLNKKYSDLPSEILCSIDLDILVNSLIGRGVYFVNSISNDGVFVFDMYQ